MRGSESEENEMVVLRGKMAALRRMVVLRRPLQWRDVCPPHPDERAALLRPSHQVQRPVHAGAQGRRGPGGREGKVVQVYRRKWVIHIERKTRFRRLVLFCDSAANRSLRRRNMAALFASIT
ncbi:hypothetical protein ACLB2K_040581 [Fragaria x ananassa]